jgi:putative ABC transport system permease protein
MLLIQSLAHLQNVDLGFRPDHILTTTINLPIAQYPTQEKAEAFYRTLISEIEALPGVVSAGVTSGVPMGGGNTSMPIMPLEKQPGVPEQGIQVSWRMATGDYFRALGIPLLQGRLFDASDTKRSAIILSEDLVRRLWHDGASPIDRQVRLGNGIVYTVIGIVGDVKLTDVREEAPAAAMYFQPFFLSALTLTIRTTIDPADLTNALKDTVRRVDPAQPLSNIRTMDVIVETNIERSRLQTTLLAAFACLALLLGAIGVAGVVAYTVERRTPELAVRLALGATPGQAMHIAARAGSIASLTGLAFGLLGARGLSETLSGLLYKVQPDDPMTFASVGTALFAVSIGACWLTARRATRIDPAEALKQE